VELQFKLLTFIKHKTQKILQPKYVYSLEVGEFVYKYHKSQVPATLSNHFKLVTDLNSYNMRQTKTRQFELTKVRSNLGTKC